MLKYVFFLAALFSGNFGLKAGSNYWKPKKIISNTNQDSFVIIRHSKIY